MDVEVQNSLGAAVASGSDNLLNVAAGDTFTISTSAQLVTLPIDVYTANYSITSSGDVSGGAEYDDNTMGHNFAITENRYSIDGSEYTDQPQFSRMGTDRVIDGEDGFRMSSAYEITGQETLSGVEITLYPDETFPGAYLMATLIHSKISSTITTLIAGLPVVNTLHNYPSRYRCGLCFYSFSDLMPIMK